MVNWKDHQVVIIGIGRQGIALAKYLVAQGARVILNDHREAGEMESVRQSLSDLPVEWALGNHPLTLLSGTDVLAVSGGVPLSLPLIQEARKRGILLTNDSQVFMDAVPCKVIGITGSAGKTTTTTLAGRMAQAAFGAEHVWVGGNIGNPLIADIDKMKDTDLAIVEFSSFQLELMTTAPQIAAVLNITPNHLDRHGTMEAYTAAKARIVEYQTAADVTVLGREDAGAWNLAGRAPGRATSFGMQRPPANQSGTYLQGDTLTFWDGENDHSLFSRQKILLRGEHNILNVLAACAIAREAGISPAAMEAGVEHFAGVEHRLEFVRSWKGVDWYNDSIATAPERAIAAINSFEEPLVLLAGGRDKDLPWASFAGLVNRRVRQVVLFGETADIIQQALSAAAKSGGCQKSSVVRCQDLEDAVITTAKLVRPGDVVLFSPGGTSFDEFRDFAERGEWFRKWVSELT
ncbi:MAG: UDP-N-acetylmuramoyl-L-alanine--D-glutamate ligase [Anaerolineaceae bacterium 4572_5.1]|nr:MAG: UDP-N-acetylmuramoyl-L-alanine--D-glutamate ligase [Anaerolineaceae bacterium 4572_5.1]RLD08735.1 MAG: UDP-N-acetylmuramoyl-L-alanine--D-glutamate ligase [Chloroflexota bacterium]